MAPTVQVNHRMTHHSINCHLTDNWLTNRPQSEPRVLSRMRFCDNLVECVWKQELRANEVIRDGQSSDGLPVTQSRDISVTIGHIGVGPTIPDIDKPGLNSFNADWCEFWNRTNLSKSRIDIQLEYRNHWFTCDVILVAKLKITVLLWNQYINRSTEYTECSLLWQLWATLSPDGSA